MDCETPKLSSSDEADRRKKQKDNKKWKRETFQTIGSVGVDSMAEKSFVWLQPEGEIRI